jgi:hypothetical protein
MSPEPRGGVGNWPPAAQAALGVGLGCALLVLLQAILFWLAIQALYPPLEQPPGAPAKAPDAAAPRQSAPPPKQN